MAAKVKVESNAKSYPLQGRPTLKGMGGSSLVIRMNVSSWCLTMH